MKSNIRKCIAILIALGCTVSAYAVNQVITSGQEQSALPLMSKNESMSGPVKQQNPIQIDLESQNQKIQSQESKIKDLSNTVSKDSIATHKKLSELNAKVSHNHVQIVGIKKSIHNFEVQTPVEITLVSIYSNGKNLSAEFNINDSLKTVDHSTELSPKVHLEKISENAVTIQAMHKPITLKIGNKLKVFSEITK